MLANAFKREAGERSSTDFDNYTRTFTKLRCLHRAHLSFLVAQVTNESLSKCFF